VECYTPPIFWPSLLQLHAAAFGAAGRPADGLPLIEEAIQIASSGSARLAIPEFLGLQGDLLLAMHPGNVARAENLYQQAVDTTKETKATMLELRAAMKLSRLRQSQGKIEQARSVLNNAYVKMTEGFKIPDLIQAQALLKDLT
jgi:predicted ATPase